MKALLLTEYKNLELTDMPEPEIGPDEVLIQVKACGICGSDIHGYDGSSGRRIPPLVMGHEASGIIAGRGSQVTDLDEGDAVTFDSTIWCGACSFCWRGATNLCNNRRVLGVSCGDYRQHGAFAEFVAVPRRIVYRLPETLGFEQAALIEAVSVAVHAANRTPIQLGDSALVVGSGMIGLLVIQALKLAGCSRVIATDLSPARLTLAKRLGADETILADKDVNVPESVMEITGGQGVDVALEVVGATATVNTAIDATRKGGAITLVGNLAPQIELPLQKVVTRELDVYGSCASNGEYPACIDLMGRKAIDVDPLITAKAGLESGADWFSRLYDGGEDLMKVLLCPSSDN